MTVFFASYCHDPYPRAAAAVADVDGDCDVDITAADAVAADLLVLFL